MQHGTSKLKARIRWRPAVQRSGVLTSQMSEGQRTGQLCPSHSHQGTHPAGRLQDQLQSWLAWLTEESSKESSARQAVSTYVQVVWHGACRQVKRARSVPQRTGQALQKQTQRYLLEAAPCTALRRQESVCIPRCSPSEKGPSHFGLSGPYQMELGLEAFTVRRMLVMRFCRAPHACQPEAQIECDLMAARPTRALSSVPGRRWDLCIGCRRCTTSRAARSYRQPFQLIRCFLV